MHLDYLITASMLDNEVCEVTETDPMSEATAIIPENEQNPAPIVPPIIDSGPYMCRLGSCNVTMPYEPMLHHVQLSHNNMYCEVLHIKFCGLYQL